MADHALFLVNGDLDWTYIYTSFYKKRGGAMQIFGGMPSQNINRMLTVIELCGILSLLSRLRRIVFGIWPWEFCDLWPSHAGKLLVRSLRKAIALYLTTQRPLWSNLCQNWVTNRCAKQQYNNKNKKVSTRKTMGIDCRRHNLTSKDV